MPTLMMAALAATFLLFVWIGLRARPPGENLDEYLTARNSQTATTLGLSFLASGMGAWILFVPPEIGAFVGPVAVAGYALASALPFVLLGLLGPLIRHHLPQGRSITEYAQYRFGAGMRHWVAALSVLYMLCFLAAELTAIGAITTMLSGHSGAWAVVGVAVATLAYTAWGGLRASLVTDRWQAWLLVGLLALVLLVAAQVLPALPALASWPTAPATDAWSVALTLVIAVTAANLFHQGYWQRVWAARDDRALWQGACIGGLATVVVVAVVGMVGVVVAASGMALGQPPAPFFALLAAGPEWLALPALLLAVALVASSVDTLQNGIASLLVTARPRATLAGARWITVLLMLPVVMLALQGISVLRLFLIADLLCATAVVPLLLGLWGRMTTRAAVGGALAGLLGALLPGWVSSGSLWQGVLAATFPASVPTLGPFLGALLASSLASGLLLLTNRATPR